MSEHPLTHNDRMALDPQRKVVAKMARTTFTNVYEPPIDDACVKIDILQKELNIEQIMDNVTSAMSIDALMNEVGEKKAFRQRLLIAWQMVCLLCLFLLISTPFTASISDLERILAYGGRTIGPLFLPFAI